MNLSRKDVKKIIYKKFGTLVLNRWNLGHGIVIKQEEEDLFYVVKCSLPNSNDGLEQRQRNVEAFIRELTLLKMLHHPGIIDTILLEHDAQIPMVVMRSPYLNGLDLGSFRLSFRYFNSYYFYTVLSQTIAALEYLHQERIIHANLNPSHIFVHQHEDTVQIKIGNFRQARRTWDNQTDDNQDDFGGWAYLPPEFLSNQISQAGDIFSLGHIIYFLLYGRSPWGSVSEQRIKFLLAEELFLPYRLKSDSTDLNLLHFNATLADPAARWPISLIREQFEKSRLYLVETRLRDTNKELAKQKNLITFLREIGMENYSILHTSSLFSIVLHHSKPKKIYKINFPEQGFNNDLDQDESLRLLGKEIKILHQLRHDHIISYIGTSFNHKISLSILILPYMKRGSLKALFEKEGTLSLEMLSEILYQWLCGLEYLHNKKIIHADVKPANVLIDDRGFLQISDFNLSIQYEEESTRCDPLPIKAHVGTRSFMAPEVKSASYIGFKSDIFSLGVSLYYLLTGDFLSWNFSVPIYPSDPILNKVSELRWKNIFSECLQEDLAYRASAKTLLSIHYSLFAHSRDESTKNSYAISIFDSTAMTAKLI